MKVFFCTVILVFLFFNNSVFAETDKEKLKKIDNQLISIKDLYESGVFSETEYKEKELILLNKKSLIQNKKKKSKKKSKEGSSALEAQLKTIKKLFDDGVLSEEEYLKTKRFLEDKEASGENIVLEKAKSLPSYTLDIKKDPGKKAWEKAEITFKNYKVSTYRPGGIKIVRISDNKTLLRITDNFKIKYYDNAKSIIEIKKTVYDPPTMEEDFNRQMEDLKKLFEGKREKKPVWDKESHKLELFIEGTKILHYEGRFVNKHKAYFYQVLTSNFQPFHFYIKLRGKTAIALNMEFFNMKIDRAVRKVKKELAAEFDVTEEQIEQIINKKIGEEADKAIQEGVEKAINDSVREAIEQTVGEVMSANLIRAIEEATGEAIEASIESELAAAIDAEIAYAVSIGIEEAAVTAGWEAYFEVLAQGGSVQQASDAAYEACGSACDNY